MKQWDNNRIKNVSLAASITYITSITYRIYSRTSQKNNDSFRYATPSIF